ncbi:MULTISPECIES: hypothetical protein [unclassified Streptomyces]|uniref:hypothetical protein n=1 Tax=unclassified Streptomyces TaxID=2593676 RepID=UPI0032AFF817
MAVTAAALVSESFAVIRRDLRGCGLTGPRTDRDYRIPASTATVSPRADWHRSVPAGAARDALRQEQIVQAADSRHDRRLLALAALMWRSVVSYAIRVRGPAPGPATGARMLSRKHRFT